MINMLLEARRIILSTVIFVDFALMAKVGGTVATRASRSPFAASDAAEISVAISFDYVSEREGYLALI